MFDTLTTANWRDFAQRYVETYAIYNKRVVYIANADEDNVYFRTEPKGITYNANRDSGVMFEFIQVDRAWVLGKSGTPYYLQRIAARQWRRGIHRANTGIASYLPVTGMTPVGVSLPVLQDIYEAGAKKSCDYAEVLSKHFLAVNNGALYFYTQPVGEVVILDNRKVIRLPGDCLVKQEVMDVLRRTGKDKDYTLEVTDV